MFFLRVRWQHWLILAVMCLQIFTHTFWLSLSTQSGQVTLPWLMNHGYTLFGNAIEQRAPLSAVILAAAQRLVPLAPDEVVRWLNIALVLVLDVIIYTLAKRFSGGRVLAGSAALLIWAWWEPVFGNVMFYFDTLLGLCVLAGLLILTSMPRQRPDSESGTEFAFQRYFFAGVCLGLGVLFKQHGWACVGAVGLWLLFQRRHRMVSVLAYTTGVLLPVLLTAGVIAAQGNLDSYLYWNYRVNFEGYVIPAVIEGDFIRRLLLLNAFVLPFALLSLRDSMHRSRHSLLLMLWAGALLPLFPHGGDIHAMTFLPLTAIMSGVVLAKLSGVPPQNILDFFKQGSPAELTLTGILGLLLLLWGFTGLAPQLSAPLGRGAIIAYDEFLPVAEVIRERAAADDRLFILPQFDGTPQLLVQTGLLPPGTWTNHDGVFLRGRDFLPVKTMLAELEAAPPRFIVYFPDLTLVRDVRPAIDPLIAFLERQPYIEIRRFESIPFNGEAIVYEYQGD